MTSNQNTPYGYYELGLRADMLEVELKAACQACTHLHEKLEAAEADWRASAERYDREVVQLRSELKEAEAEAAKWRDDAERLLQAKDAAEARAERAEFGQRVCNQEIDWLRKAREDSAEYQRDIERRAETFREWHARAVAAEAECVRANDSARARDERAARRIDELEAQLAETRERLEAHRQNLAAANEWGARAEAKLSQLEALLKKPGCWSEWARECLAVLKGGGQ